MLNKTRIIKRTALVIFGIILLLLECHYIETKQFNMAIVTLFINVVGWDIIGKLWRKS